MIAVRPVWFGSARAELLGMYHAPAAGGGKLGIVLCNPFGYEAMCTCRSYRHLADQLALRGFPVLRFDYDGTGDSSGNDRDPRRWLAWQESTTAAIEELRQLSGCAQVGLVGLRLGANLALLAAQTRRDVVALALWAPFFSGKTFLREELAVHKLRAHKTLVDARSIADGEVEALGFLLSASTYASIQAHSLDELKALHARSALVLARETPLQEARVTDRLRELGVEVHYDSAPGYTNMLRAGEPAEAVWTRLVEYFVAVRDATLPAPQVEPAAAARGHVAELLSATQQVWDAADAQAPVEETACFFGPHKRLFGVISRAAQRANAEPPTAVLLLSGGFNHHVGQNRMFTRWARAWAARGIPCLRFDLAGFGDSRTADAEPEGQLHSLGSIADLQAAMDELAAVSGSRRFAIVGLCSGAFIGFHTALADPRVTSLALLNWTYFYPSGVSVTKRSRYRSLRFYLAAATLRSTWRKLLRGRVDVRGIANHFLSSVMRRLRTSLLPRVPAIDHSSQLARDMRLLAARGVKSLIVYNGDETAIDELHEQLGVEERRLRLLGLLRIEILDGTDHIFTPTWSQERLASLLTEQLVQVDSLPPPAPYSNEIALSDG
jgi:alpha-beta hydrolase superfamily lysophospholipase